MGGKYDPVAVDHQAATSLQHKSVSKQEVRQLSPGLALHGYLSRRIETITLRTGTSTSCIVKTEGRQANLAYPSYLRTHPQRTVLAVKEFLFLR